MSKPDSIAARARRGEALDDVLLIDAHAHLGSWYQFPIWDSDSAGMLPSMDRMGVRTTCIAHIVAACGVDTQCGNDAVARTVAQSGGRFWGYTVINPNEPNGGRAEAERCATQGMRGLKIHTYHGRPYTHEVYQSAYEVAHEGGWPILCHTWGTRDLGWIREMAKRYTKAQWLCAHTGAANEEAYVEIGKELDNVHLELCSSMCPRGLVERLVRDAGAHKVLFGSDIPFTGSPMQFGRVVFAQISEEDKRRILGLNAQRVFKLEGLT